MATISVIPSGMPTAAAPSALAVVCWKLRSKTGGGEQFVARTQRKIERFG